jgi:hypothetical protein
MKAKILLLALFSLLSVSFSSPAFAPVEYVKVCSLYGSRFFYGPGTDSCIDSITGEVKTRFDDGGGGATIHRQTYVVARVRALESDYCDGCFAVVRAGGQSTRSEGVSGITHVGPGQFDVMFEKPVHGCAYSATLGIPDNDGSQQPPGIITVGRVPDTENKGLSVWIYNLRGSLVDRPFHLSAACAHKKPFCNVIDSAGTHACTGAEPVPGLGPAGP